jgi:hypothetical protein
MSKRVYIVQGDETKKGRAFGATLLAHATCNRVWDAGDSDARRPVFAQFGGTEAEMGPFEANLREGRPCGPEKGSASSRLEFLRSAGYQWTRQRSEEGITLTAYLPNVFAHDPGFVDPDRVRFVVLPSKSWAAEQRRAVGEAAIRDALAHIDRIFDFGGDHADPHLRSTAEARSTFRARLTEMIPTACLFVAALDKRVRAPVLSDLAFQMQLFLTLHTITVGGMQYTAAGSALTASIRNVRHESMGRDLWSEDGLDLMGFAPGAWCAIGQETLTKVLVDEVRRYHERRARPKARKPQHAA